MFNRMYITVTEQVAAGLVGAPLFRDPAFMARLDVTFASLWLDASTHRATRCRRHGRLCSSVVTTTRCCRSSSHWQE